MAIIRRIQHRLHHTQMELQVRYLAELNGATVDKPSAKSNTHS